MQDTMDNRRLANLSGVLKALNGLPCVSKNKCESIEGFQAAEKYAAKLKGLLPARVLSLECY